ncbi:Acetylajmalan esterase [Linum grandiflorum]
MSLLMILLFSIVAPFLLQIPAESGPSLKHCGIRTIYNLGDSLSDTGNVPFEFPGATVSHLPYGMTIHKATGRFSDGYILIDRIAEAAGLPYLNPYLNKRVDHTNGVNFAVGGVGYLSREARAKWDIRLPYSQDSIDVQLGWLEQHLNQSFRDRAARREHLKSALFVMGGGGNDYAYFKKYAAHRTPLKHKKLIMRDMFAAVKGYLKTLIIDYEATKIVVTGVYQGGCLVDWKFRDNKVHCNNDTNAYHILHNQLLQRTLEDVQKEFPSVHLVYGDVWGAHQWLLDHFWSLGYRYPNYVGCCGNAAIGCGFDGAPFCRSPKEYMYFDNLHFTDFSYGMMAKIMIPEIAAGLRCKSR